MCRAAVGADTVSCREAERERVRVGATSLLRQITRACAGIDSLGAAVRDLHEGGVGVGGGRGGMGGGGDC